MTEIPENHVKFCSVDKVQAQKTVSMRILGKPICVYVGADGTLTAREMSCKHQGADLTKGKINGTCVSCPRHGWTYDLATGERIDGDSAPLRQHPLQVVDNTVYVSLFPKSGGLTNVS